MNNLKRLGQDITDEAAAKDFVNLLRSRQSARIANQNLSLLNGFAAWAMTQNYLDGNPFEKIKLLKVTRDRSSRKPFTREEITRILDTIRIDSRYWQYYDFVLTLFNLSLIHI